MTTIDGILLKNSETEMITIDDNQGVGRGKVQKEKRKSGSQLIDRRKKKKKKNQLIGKNQFTKENQLEKIIAILIITS